MPLPVLQSPNGQVTRVVTSKEELEEYLAKGYKKVQPKAAPRQGANSND